VVSLEGSGLLRCRRRLRDRLRLLGSRARYCRAEQSMSARHAPRPMVAAGVAAAVVGVVSVVVEAEEEEEEVVVASVAVGEDAGHSNSPLFSKHETSGGWLYDAANLRCFYLSGHQVNRIPPHGGKPLLV